MACSLVFFGFHPVLASFSVDRCMVFMSPFQPLPPSTPPVNENFTFRIFISSIMILAMFFTVIWSLEPML